MTPEEVIEQAGTYLTSMNEHAFDQITLSKPSSIQEAVMMRKIVSKISSLVGNLFEIDVAEKLNAHEVFGEIGKWKRQDPDFPDVLLDWDNPVKPGFEIKAWYPFATEITGRFRDSQNAFANDSTYVLLFAWLPEHVIWGSPRILKLAVVSGRSIAAARDEHYHNPPDYLVVEPGDTQKRTKNLQQRNTAGYKWQGGDTSEAKTIIESWGPSGRDYLPTPEYQDKLRQLRSRFRYRLDTNYGKMDRVISAGVEQFKTDVSSIEIYGQTVDQWFNILKPPIDERKAKIISETFGVEFTDLL